jgi:hypothetical protein
MHVRAGKEGMMPREGRLDDAAADPGWADLTRFLEHDVGLSAGPLQRVVTLLAEEDVTNLFLLRTTFDQLPLKLGSRKLIAGALKAAAANAAPQQAASEPPAPAQLIVHAFHVLVGFKEQSVTLLLALPENDYCGQQVSHVLEQLNVQAAQQLSGAYTIVGLSTGGSRLAKEKSLRDQSVQPGAKLSAVVEGISAVHALARQGQGQAHGAGRAHTQAHHRTQARAQATTAACSRVDGGAARGGRASRQRVHPPVPPPGLKP